MGERLTFTFALTGRREWGHGTQGVALGCGLTGLSARAWPQTRLFPHNLHLLNISILLPFLSLALPSPSLPSSRCIGLSRLRRQPLLLKSTFSGFSNAPYFALSLANSAIVSFACPCPFQVLLFVMNTQHWPSG